MGKSRDRANRSGTDPINISDVRLSLEGSNDIKVTAQDGTTLKKVFAEELHVGTGDDRVILKRNSSDGKVQFQTTDGSTTTDTQVGTGVVTNPSDLPLTGNSAGDTKFVTSNNNLMIYNGTGWYKIATVTNSSPTISSAGNASYSFATDGTPIVIEIAATDPEGLALQYKYQVTSGSLGSTATVTSSSTSGGTYSAINANTLTSNKYFKVTPSTDTAHAGTFSLTFSASDGINVANSSASSFTLQFTTYGSAFFDGASDYLQVANSSQFALGTGDFTIECWVKFSETSLVGGANRRIFSLHNTTGNAIDKLQICIDDGSYRTNGDLFLYSNSDQGYLDVDIRHEWHHIAVVRNSGTLKFYLDGVEKDSNSNTQDYSPGSGSPVPLIGSRGDKGDYSGYISNFRMVVGTAVYTSNFTVPTSPLTAIANTKLLTAHRNDQIVDGSSSNHVITKVGNATEHASNPFGPVGYGSLYFDGADDYVLTPTSSDFTFGTGAFTVEGWYQPKFDTAGSTTRMLWDLGSNHVRVRFKNGQIRAQLGSETQILYNISGSSLDQTTWYHSALTRDGSGNVKLFHNGSEVGSYTGSTYDVPSTSIRIADINLALSGYEFIGYISNFRVVKGTAVYTSGFTPSTTPLTAITNTKLLTAQDSKKTFNVTSGSIHLNGGNLVATSSDFALGTGDFTIETWFRYTVSATLSDNDYVIDLGTNQLQIYFTGGEIVARIGGNNTYSVSYDLVTDLDSLNTNRFYHLAVVRNGSNTTIFFDGIQKATQSSSAFNHTNTTLTIGSHNVGHSSWYGYVTDFRIVKGKAVYTGAFTPPSGPLTKTGGTYPSSTNISNPTASETVLLIGNNSGSITDVSDSGHTFTPTGTSSASSVVPTVIATDQSSNNYKLTFNGNTRNAVNWPFNYNG